MQFYLQVRARLRETKRVTQNWVKEVKTVTDEVQINLIFEFHKQTKILQALFKFHPYEEVAYEVFKLKMKTKILVWEDR